MAVHTGNDRPLHEYGDDGSNTTTREPLRLRQPLPPAAALQPRPTCEQLHRGPGPIIRRPPQRLRETRCQKRLRCQCPFHGLSRLRNGRDPQNFRSVFACRFCHRIEFALSCPHFQFLNVRLTGCHRHRVDHEPRRRFTSIGRRTREQFAAAGCHGSMGECSC